MSPASTEIVPFAYGRHVYDEIGRLKGMQYVGWSGPKPAKDVRLVYIPDAAIVKLNYEELRSVYTTETAKSKATENSIKRVEKQNNNLIQERTRLRARAKALIKIKQDIVFEIRVLNEQLTKIGALPDSKPKIEHYSHLLRQMKVQQMRHVKVKEEEHQIIKNMRITEAKFKKNLNLLNKYRFRLRFLKKQENRLFEHMRRRRW